MALPKENEEDGCWFVCTGGVPNLNVLGTEVVRSSGFVLLLLPVLNMLLPEAAGGQF